jgi:hypothetical protein
MAISFPGSPTVGQIHTHNNLKWQWDGTSWVAYNEYGVSMTFIPSGSTRPTSPVGNQVFFNTLSNTMEMWDADSQEWRYVSQDERQYLHRQVIVKSFVMGGYKDSSPWFNVNSMNHQTDLSVNLGDLLHTKANYSSGACGLTYGYIWNASNTHFGVSTTTAGINMFTETGLVAGDCPTLLYTRSDCATVFKEHEYAYIIGGGTSDIDVFNLTTNTMYSAQSLTSQGSGYAGSFSGEDKGFAWHDSGVGNKVTFAADVTPTIVSSSVTGAHSQQKGVSSKLGKGWCGNEGSYAGGYNFRRWQFSTETNIGNVVKPQGNCGEENFDMGQYHQYCMGHYNGAQNNNTWKWYYETDSGTVLGAGSEPTGVPGRSSGHCVWRG